MPPVSAENKIVHEKKDKEPKPKTEQQTYALMRRLNKKKKKQKCDAFRKPVKSKKHAPISERRINETTFVSVKGKIIGRKKGPTSNKKCS